MRAWVQGNRERIEGMRETSATVNFAYDAFNYDAETGAPVLAAALGFRVFLFQVPYACSLVIIAGWISEITGKAIEPLKSGKGVARLTADSVSTAAGLSGWTRFFALLLALYGTFLAARSLVKVVNIIHALVWDVPRARMPRATRAGATFVGLVTVLVVSSAGIAALRDRSSLAGWFLLLLYTVVPFALWAFVSWKLPHRDVPIVAMLPGAALFAVGTEALHVATVVWFPGHIESKSDLYGTIGVAVAILLWAYLLGRVITLAAVLNASLWARFGRESEHAVAFHRPSRRFPLIDDWVSRMWTRLFGDDGNDETRDS